MIYRPARTLEDLTPEVVRLVIAWASVLRPRVFTLEEISRELLIATGGFWARPPLLYRAIARHAPELLKARALAREAARPKVRPVDLRTSPLDARTRANILARARVMIEDEDGAVRPRYTLEDLGRLAPHPLNWQQTRRAIAREPGGAEVLRGRFEARRRKGSGSGS